MDWALSVFQTIGAALGFVATGITVWHHFTRDRPTAVIVGAPLGGLGQRSGYLKVRNRSDRPILLHITGGKYRHEFSVWPDHETISAVYGVLSGTRTLLTIEPDSEALLPLIRPSLFDEISEGSEIIATLHWSFAQPILWRPRRQLRVSISKWAYLAVEAGTLRETGGDA